MTVEGIMDDSHIKAVQFPVLAKLNHWLLVIHTELQHNGKTYCSKYKYRPVPKDSHIAAYMESPNEGEIITYGLYQRQDDYYNDRPYMMATVQG